MPFKIHRSFPEPPNFQSKIWRYIDFVKFVDMLDSGSLHFSRLSRMPDKGEGALTSASRSQLVYWSRGPGIDEAEANRRADIWEREVYLINQYTTFVSCWHVRDQETPGMWAQYGNRGIAIRSTYSRLTSSFDDVKQEVYCGAVQYGDPNLVTLDPGNTLFPSMFKLSEFEDERELRAAITSHPENWKSLVDDEQLLAIAQPIGIPVVVDLNLLIESVYVGPDSTTWFPDLIKRVLDKYEVNATVERSAVNRCPVFAQSK